MTYFTARSNFETYAFSWENVTMIDSSEIIESYDLDFDLHIILGELLDTGPLVLWSLIKA